MDGILVELAKLGLPGLFIAYLIWQNRQLVDRLDKANETIAALQEKRIGESREQGDIIRGNMTALNAFNESVRALLQRRVR